LRVVPERFWIAEIQISEEMEAKIRRRRFVTGDEVREACVPDAYDRAGWEDDEEHGRRLLVVCRTAQGRRLKVVLQPIDVHEGIWRLRTSCCLTGAGHSSSGFRGS
jgi:hypothetical protein